MNNDIWILQINDIQGLFLDSQNRILGAYSHLNKAVSILATAIDRDMVFPENFNDYKTYIIKASHFTLSHI